MGLPSNVLAGLVSSGPAHYTYANATTAVTFAGASLTAGTGASAPAFYMPAQVGGLSPLLSAGITPVNTGVSGITITNMNGLLDTLVGSNNLNVNFSTVDNSYVAGKTNILVLNEGANYLRYVSTSTTDFANAVAAYIAARKATHDWRVVWWTNLPFYSNTSLLGQTIPQMNASLIDYNTYFRANYAAMGIDTLADPAGPTTVWGAFQLAGDFSLAAFDTPPIANYWTTTDTPGTHSHLNDAGYALLASYIAGALRRLLAVRTDAPLVSSMTIADATSTVDNTILNRAQVGALPDVSAFASTVDGVARAVDSIATVDSTHFNLTLNSAPTAAQDVKVSYTKPVTNPIVDANGNALATFGLTSILNNVNGSVLRMGTLSGGGIAPIESGDGTVGWNYAARPNSVGGTSIACVPSLSVPANTDFELVWEIRDALELNGNISVYLCNVSTATSIVAAGSLYGFNSVGSTNFRLYVNHVLNTTYPGGGYLVGDRGRIKGVFSAGTIAFDFQRAGAWHNVLTLTGQTWVQMYPQIAFNTGAATTAKVYNIRSVGMT